MTELSDDLKQVAEYASEAKGQIDKVYLHWTAGHYDQVFDDYHICILENGAPYITTDFTDYLSHTWKRNSRAIGVSLTCAYNATLLNRNEVDFGPEPPTFKQVDGMAQVMAVLSHELGLPLDDEHFMTHHEAAEIDGYGPWGDDPDCRWDLYLLQDHPGTELRSGGDVLRGKAEWWHQTFYGYPSNGKMGD